MSKPIATVLWRGLDTPGHDACRLSRRNGGWSIAGDALFLHEGKACSLAYEINCDRNWKTRTARVRGWLAAEPIDWTIRNAGTWLLNDIEQPGLQALTDLDLGFTPATNILPIRRFGLETGEIVPAPAAYLRFPERRLELLEQSYRRVGETAYAYESPSFGYSAVLQVSGCGFVLDYPGLWQAESYLGP